MLSKMKMSVSGFCQLVLILSPFAWSCTTTSNANELEGSVTMVGSAPNARPIVEVAADKSQTHFCPGTQQDYLRKFSGTIVKVNGAWSTDKNTKEKCFEIANFQVTQITKGRPAFVGMLTKDAANTKFTIEAEDGKKYVLESPTKGVKELAGKRVISDLVPASQTSEVKSAEPTWKVVSYMEYPSL